MIWFRLDFMYSISFPNEKEGKGNFVNKVRYVLLKGGYYLRKYIRYVLKQPCLPILAQSLAEYHLSVLWPATNENTEKLAKSEVPYIWKFLDVVVGINFSSFW